MSLKRGIVKLENHNPNWEKEYKKEEKLLKKLLKDEIIEIHHVGSTSIKGLMAKPIIDILIVIKSLNNIEKIDKILSLYNYHNRGNQGIEDRIFFAKGSDDARTHYIHFTEPNSNTYYDLMYFKKYLEEHPNYLKEYCNLKKELAEKYSLDRKKYTEGKSDFIKNIIKLAKEEYND